jgi:ABC-type lipoprotein release transport system permease subunit
VTFISFLFRRSRHYWLLLLTLVFGVILATTFLASGPVLIDALMEFGLRRTLLNAEVKTDVVYLSVRESSNQKEYQALDDQLQNFIVERSNPLVTNLIPVGHVGYMHLWRNGQIFPDQRLSLGFYGNDFNELEQHVIFEEGSFPESDSQNLNEIPVIIGAFLAKDMGIRVGDRLPVSVRTLATQPDLFLRVNGIITPQDYLDQYWLDHFNPFWPLVDAGELKLYGVFVDRESFFDLAEGLYPSLDVSYNWKVNIDLDQFEFDNLEGIQNTFISLGDEGVSIHDKLRVNSTLIELLSDYSLQANIVRSPLYFLIGIIALMALYYLVMMSSLYLEQLRSEFAIMRSRGATGSLLFKFELMDGILFSGIAIISGPLFAWVIVRWLAISGPLATLAEPDWGLSISQAAWLSACIAAIASISSLLLPLPGALKQSITTHQQNLVRAGRQPWWQRFYLDVFVLAIGIILLYRVEFYGSIIGGPATDPQLDLMLILAPLCLLLGAATIFLRIFPALLQRSARLASWGRGLPVVLALRQASRDPKHVTRLVLLLMLAMTLGLFSTSLDATLTKNELDRSRYYVGGDFRVIADPAAVETEDLSGALRESWIWRSDAALITSGYPPGLDLLAVDPKTFSTVSQFRSDFATQPVKQLLQKLNADWEENLIPWPVTILPGEPVKIGVWFSLPFSMQIEPDRFDMVAATTFEARLRSDQDEDIIVKLKPVGPPEDPDSPWYYFQGDILELSPESYPLSMISLWFHNSELKLGDFETIWIDDISVVDRLTGNEIVVESFEYANQFVWEALTYPMRVYGMETHPHTGEASLAMLFDRVGISPLRWYGVSRVEDRELQPIPALVSPDFLAGTESQPGDLVRIKVKVPGAHEWDHITFKILDLVNYFPTLYETQEAGFLVTLRDPLFEQINLYRYNPLPYNEVLISSTDSGATRTALLDSGLLPGEFLSADALLLELRTNPLAIGLRSVTLFGYFLTTVLSLVGFGTHFYLNTRRRAANYSILRALGLSPGQLYSTLLLEQIILMLSGLALGTILGLLLNQLTLSGLPLRLGEVDTIPPFLVQTDWGLIFRVYLTLVITFLISLGMAILFLWRIQIHRVLRIGEE